MCTRFSILPISFNMYFLLRQTLFVLKFFFTLLEFPTFICIDTGNHEDVGALLYSQIPTDSLVQIQKCQRYAYMQIRIPFVCIRSYAYLHIVTPLLDMVYTVARMLMQVHREAENHSVVLHESQRTHGTFHSMLQWQYTSTSVNVVFDMAVADYRISKRCGYCWYT